MVEAILLGTDALHLVFRCPRVTCGGEIRFVEARTENYRWRKYPEGYNPH
jgi:hypothetical protein